MSTLAQVTSQPTNDPNMRAFHTRFEMTSSPESGQRGHCSELSEFGRLVLEIRGLTQVQIAPYVMLISKAPLFTWNEIEPSVHNILACFASSQEQMERALNGKDDEAGSEPRISRYRAAGAPL